VLENPTENAIGWECGAAELEMVTRKGVDSDNEDGDDPDESEDDEDEEEEEEDDDA